MQVNVTHLERGSHHVDVYADGKIIAAAQDEILELPNGQSGFFNPQLLSSAMVVPPQNKQGVFVREVLVER